MKLFIKNMVSIRCKLVVKSALEDLDLHYYAIEFGEVSLQEPVPADKLESLQKIIGASGLELLDSRKAILVEKIKNVIIEMIHYSDELPKTNFSDFLSEKLQYGYTYLSNLFSEVKGFTIEHFIIAHKIERAKELLLYGELTLTEIASALHYSSVGHLSNQFKAVTGMKPSDFKKLKDKPLINLEDI